MNRVRPPPLQHPLAAVFERSVDSLGIALSPDTPRHYRGTVRKFLCYLAVDHPEVNRLDQLRREPHILGWMSRLRSQTPPLSTASCINQLIALRCIFNDLAWSNQPSELARRIRREDIPRTPQRLPRPLTAEPDQLLQQEFLRRNDLGGNAFLLIRYTGMRIGECADLSCDCLRSTGPNQWAIHVPLGKLKTERMAPVDASTCELVQRLRFFRSLDPLPADGRLLARPGSKEALVRQLRDYLHQLLGHTNPEMTMRYVDVAFDRSPARVPPSTSPPKVSGPTAKGFIHSPSCRPRRRHRFFARLSTCVGDVSSPATKGRFSLLPRPALQPSHQDPHRSPQTTHNLRLGRDWPVKPTNRPEPSLGLPPDAK